MNLIAGYMLGAAQCTLFQNLDVIWFALLISRQFRSVSCALPDLSICQKKVRKQFWETFGRKLEYKSNK